MRLAPISVLILLSTLASQQPQGRLTIDLAMEWETVSSPRLSPDGRQILYTRTWVDKVNDERKSSLWLMQVDGTRNRQLLEGSGAEWSPDGTRIAYVAEGKPRGSQVWVLWVATREATQLTHLDESPSGLRWSPDGARLSFNMNVPEKDGLKIKLPDRPKDAKWAADAKVITRLHYRRDGQGYRPAGYRHLFVVDAQGGGTPRQVTTGDFDHGNGEWTPDGKELLFSGLRTADADWASRESEVYAVDADSGTVRQLTTRKGPDQNPRPSPDGKLIAYTGYDHTRDSYEVTKVYVMGNDGSNARALTAALDRDPGEMFWASDSSGVFFSADSEGTRNLWFTGLDGKVAQVTRGIHTFLATDLAPGNVCVGVLADIKHPGDVAILRPGTDPQLTRLTRVNDDVLAQVRTGEVEEVRCKSKDGLPVQGWLVKPPDFDPGRKWPLILQIHGGPHAMFNVGFDFERHNHAAEGFLLLYTNPRGSTGYGKSFGNAINNAYPGQDYDDLMAAVDAVVARGCVDEQQLYVYGGSGGGVLTAWIVGHTDRFRAAVSMYPVIDWISFVGTTDGPSWYENFKKLPWEDITEHWERSPLKYVGNVKTPTMVLTGELDLRTPMSQSEEYYQALKLRKVETALVRIQDEYHGASARHVSNQMRRILYVREWFKQHAPAAPTAEASGRTGSNR